MFDARAARRRPIRPAYRGGLMGYVLPRASPCNGTATVSFPPSRCGCCRSPPVRQNTRPPWVHGMNHGRGNWRAPNQGYRSTPMRTSIKSFLGVAAAGSLMFSLAACGPANKASSAPASSSAAAAEARATGLHPGTDRGVHRGEAGRLLRQGLGDPEADPGRDRHRRTDRRVAGVPDHRRQGRLLRPRQGLPPLRPGPDQPRRLRLLPHRRGHQGGPDQLHHRPGHLQALR